MRECRKRCFDCGGKVSSEKTKRCRKCRNKFAVGANNHAHSHGLTTKGKTDRFYKIWAHLRARSTCPTDAAYADYGGRGIRCLWASFEDFQRDMFVSYKCHVEVHGTHNTTIDRIDNDGPYSKENCKWSTRKEQAKNRRTTVLIEYEGKRLCLADWSRSRGFDRRAISQRMKRGWSFEKAINTPL